MKTVKELAEERYPDNTMIELDVINRQKEDFIAGHQSRGEEVKKLVEQLEAFQRVASCGYNADEYIDQNKTPTK